MARPTMATRGARETGGPPKHCGAGSGGRGRGGAAVRPETTRLQLQQRTCVCGEATAPRSRMRCLLYQSRDLAGPNPAVAPRGGYIPADTHLSARSHVGVDASPDGGDVNDPIHAHLAERKESHSQWGQ